MGLYIILAIVAVIILLIAFAPRKYAVERSIVINRNRSDVFDYVKYIKNSENWSPWDEKDPDMKKEYRGTDGEVGFVPAWEGNKQVGSGEQEIVSIVEGERVNSALRFFKPWKSESDAYLSLEDDGEGTRVRWGFSGVNPIPFNVFMLFMNMDKAVGKDFEFGLNKLKSIMES